MTTSRHELIDRLHDGKFDARLLKMRSDGLSYRQIANTLSDDGFVVTHETVRQWCLDLTPTERTP